MLLDRKDLVFFLKWPSNSHGCASTPWFIAIVVFNASTLPEYSNCEILDINCLVLELKSVPFPLWILSNLFSRLNLKALRVWNHFLEIIFQLARP